MARTCMCSPVLYHCAMLKPSTLQHLMWLQALTDLTHCGMQAEQRKQKSPLIWAAFGLFRPVPQLPVIRLKFPRRFTPHGTRSAAWLAHTRLQEQSIPHHSRSLTLPLNGPCAEWGTGVVGAWQILHRRLLLCEHRHTNCSTHQMSYSCTSRLQREYCSPAFGSYTYLSVLFSEASCPWRM